MSWLSFLTQLGIGVANNMARDYAARQQGRYDFCVHMQILAQENRLRLNSVKPLMASFSYVQNGQSYPVVALPDGEVISIAVCSLITYPAGGAPQNVRRFLEQKSRDYPSWSFGLEDTKSGAFFYIDGRVRHSSLTPEVFAEMLAEMAPLIAAIDTWLIDNGYAH